MSFTVELKWVLILKSELTLKFKSQNLNSFNRIRNNQRKSKAQRKKYLQKLKSKLRKYESMSMKASLKIQASVRLVAEKNRHLQALLQSQDVVSQKIETTVATSSVEAQTSSRTLILKTKLNTKKSCIEKMCKTDLKSQQFNTSSSLQSLTESCNNICKWSLISMSLRTTTTNSVSSNSMITSAFSSMNLLSHLMNCYEKESWNLSSKISFDNDTTSYTFVVEIITSMRANVSAEDVKTELEYDKDVKCNIDNSTLFNIEVFSAWCTFRSRAHSKLD